MRIRPGTVALITAALLTLAGGGRLRAQVLPEEPVTLANGRVTVGADVTGTYGCAISSGAACGADTGYYNYSDYEHSALRMFRFDLSGSAALGRRVVALGEIRSENAERPQVYALYLRWTPWSGRRIDVQAGRIPPTFGPFARRTYPSDNPLIGYPLAYQYLTSLRADALPATVDELLSMRGRGWLSAFSLGNRTPERGMPLVSAFAWDTGVQIHGETDRFEGTVAVTAGTAGNPRVRDDNSGRQVAGRGVARPVIGLVLGMSAARGPFIADEAMAASGRTDGGPLAQTTWGADAEFSRGHYLVRVEALRSTWTIPLGAGRDLPLPAAALSVEGRYKFGPALWVAARADRLAFGTVQGSSSPDEWDAPVTRIEVGGGYALQRHLLLKTSFQRNRRDTLYVPARDFVTAQIVAWF